jgi:predicted RNA-binding protein with TRAM domain
MLREVSMRRFLLTTVAVLGLVLPATAQDAEVGKEYEITIQTEQNNQYTGPFGQAKIGAIAVNVPDAKVKERYRVKITDIRENQYTGEKQASCDFQQLGGNRKGMCIPAP